MVLTQVLPKEANFSRLKIFADLTDEEIERFIQATAAHLKWFDKNTRILTAYETNTNIGVLVEGRAQIVTEDCCGNETIGYELDRGAVFGSVSAILGEEYGVVSVETRSKAAVLWFPFQNLLTQSGRLGRIHGIVMRNFLEILSCRAVVMMQKITVLSRRTVRERLALYLEQQAEDVIVPGRVRLAKILECNRSALTREIKKMETAGILTCQGKTMRLLERVCAP